MNRKSCWAPLGLALATALHSAAFAATPDTPPAKKKKPAASPAKTAEPTPPAKSPELANPTATTKQPVVPNLGPTPIQPAARPVTPVNPATAPKLVIEETTFNAGDVAKGDTITHDYVVKNTGKGELQILTVKPACGCTAPDWTKVIPAGGTGRISLKVDTSKFKGPISKTATVDSNDPEAADLRLTLNADVKTTIDVLPRDVVTFRQYKGEEQKQELTIHSNEPGEFKISDVNVTGEGIKHELGKDGSDYKLTVWMDKAAPVGNAQGTIKLATNSTKQPEIDIDVRGTILGQISVNPSTLYFRVDNSSRQYVPQGANVNIRERGEADAPVVAKVGKDEVMKALEEAGDWAKVELTSGQQGWVMKKLVTTAPSADSKQAKILNVTHREASSFKITGTAVEGQQLDAKALNVATEAVQQGQSYRVTVTYAGGLAKGNYTGMLVLKTNDGEEPEVRVPLYVVVT